jgi:hypothetical protein
MLSGGLIRPCAPADDVNKKSAHSNDIITVNNLLKIFFII